MSQLKKSRKIASPEEIIDRLKNAWEIGKDADLAKKLDVNPSTLASWKKLGAMKYDRILEQASDLNMNWVFYGEGPVRARSSDSGRAAPTAEDEMITYLADPAVNDLTRTGERENRIQLEFPAPFIRQELGADPNRLFLSRMQGDSMQPTLEDRDFILVDRSAQRPYAGRIYLIRLDGSRLCKRISEEPGHRLLLFSDNRQHPEVAVDSDYADLELLGRVIWFGRAL